RQGGVWGLIFKSSILISFSF
ncbi:hypothetical protein Zm00014a_026864, partial [Zea mays]